MAMYVPVLEKLCVHHRIYMYHAKAARQHLHYSYSHMTPRGGSRGSAALVWSVEVWNPQSKQEPSILQSSIL